MKIEEVVDNLLDKLFEKWPDFDRHAEDAQEQWSKLEWTMAEEDEYREWAVKFVMTGLRLSNKRARRELAWFLFKYAPKTSDYKFPVKR